MTNASPAFLVDTNVLVYAYDPADPAKRERAIAVLRALQASGLGALSVQVLGEFFSATTKKLNPPLPPSEAGEAVINLYRSWEVFELYLPMVIDAVRGVSAHRFSYWDALIWATAKHNGLPFVLSEDFNDGQVVEGVRIVNPFETSFDLGILQ
jgi:predicted nucleic acid-binding protein